MFTNERSNLHTIPVCHCLVLSLILMAFLALLPLKALAFLPDYTGTVIVTSSGAPMDLALETSRSGLAELSLLDETTFTSYTLAEDVSVQKGANICPWNGLTVEGEGVPAGEYTLSVYLVDPVIKASSAPKNTMPPTSDPSAPLFSIVSQSTDKLTVRGVDVVFHARKPGMLTVSLVVGGSGEVVPLVAMELGAGEMAYHWEGNLDGVRVPTGQYALRFVFAAGDEQMETTVDFQVLAVSKPYSDVDDGSYWSMAPGEIDDELIWSILTQPINIFNNHEMHPSGHVYLMENPDGTGKRVAQIHAMSQGLHIIGQTNEFGYILVESFSNYDPVFQPKKPEDIAQAFEIKRGYIEAAHIKYMPVSQHIGLLVDKLTQRMYVFIDGKRATEFIISTGTTAGNRMYRETIPGEFTTISYVGSFASGEVISDMGIRYNGGSLIHEVPHVVNGEGRRNYVPFERLLGQKASAGCVRVPRQKNPDGYNMKWLWENLLVTPQLEQPRYKVLVWDDRNRGDTPEIWYPDPDYVVRKAVPITETIVGIPFGGR